MGVNDAEWIPSETLVALTNAQPSALLVGAPVYSNATGTVRLAKADLLATAKIIGLMANTTAIAALGTVQTDGILTLTTGEWDAITGDVGGLTADGVYYLDNTTAGKLTTVVPTTGLVIRVGTGVSTTKLNISIQQPVIL